MNLSHIVLFGSVPSNIHLGDDFKQLLDKTFNKSLPEIENVQIEDPVMVAELSEYQLLQTICIALCDLNQRNLRSIPLEFIKNIKDSRIDTHFYQNAMASSSTT